MLKTLRFRPACFLAEQPALRIDQIQKIHIKYDRPGRRALAFDDLQLVKQP